MAEEYIEERDEVQFEVYGPLGRFLINRRRRKEGRPILQRNKGT